jgi:hypothetical protein
VKRYIVLGLERDVEWFRRERGLSRRDVIGVSPHGRGDRLRGLAGDFEVITLESWRHASLNTILEVEHNIRIIRATSGATEIILTENPGPTPSDGPFGIKVIEDPSIPPDTFYAIGSCGCGHHGHQHGPRGCRAITAERDNIGIICDCDTPVSRLAAKTTGIGDTP